MCISLSREYFEVSASAEQGGGLIQGSLSTVSHVCSWDNEQVEAKLKEQFISPFLLLNKFYISRCLGKTIIIVIVFTIDMF